MTDETPAPLDAFDRRILDVVAVDGRIAVVDLARAIGLSKSPTQARLRRLEQAGVIRGYRAELDQAKLGLPDTVIIEVMTEKHDGEQLARFEEAIAAMPEVIEAWLVTGEYDYILKAAVGGTAGYERLLREKIYRLPGVRHTRTAFGIRCLKQVFTPLPV